MFIKIQKKKKYITAWHGHGNNTAHGYVDVGKFFRLRSQLYLAHYCSSFYPYNIFVVVVSYMNGMCDKRSMGNNCKKRFGHNQP